MNTEHPTPGPDFEAPDMAIDSTPADPAPVTGGRRHSARRYGKTYLRALDLSQRTGLTIETCLDLLHSGWTYVECLGEPPKWLYPGFRLTWRPQTTTL